MCFRYTNNLCKARITTDSDGMTIVKILHEHNHVADDRKTEAKRLRVRSRKQSGDISSRPTKIVGTELQGMQESTLQPRDASLAFYRRAPVRPHPVDNANIDVLDLSTAFGCKFIEFIIRRTAYPASESSTCLNSNNASASNIPSSANTFNILMGNSAKIFLQDKPKADGPQRLLCHIVDLMESKGCGWTLDCFDTANFVAKSLRDTLWNKKISDDIEQFLECITKYKTRLDIDNSQNKELYQSGEKPRRSLESDASLQYIPPAASTSRDSYRTWQSDLNMIDDYRFVDLGKYAPEDRLTGFEAVSETMGQAKDDERVTELLLNSDDSDLLLDYSTLNGKDIDTKIETFFEEIG
ncbi:unnamed protein product [Mytilus coruscus]|uniref:FLYWCH-type domain-containing protein n=1 Tax=Mytilus coruscus TaxID=42192 RepID=A0A6J8B6M5_MYTCO|nr:unnamed protein product [Mytilus coruscus]